MASRLLARLDAAIATTRQPIELACLRAERAAFLARQGRLDDARRTLADLHARFALRPHPAVSAWTALAEGICDYFESMAPHARDRLQRAHVLSRAAELAPLRVLAAAWLAHLELMASDMTPMAAHLVEALRDAAPDHHAARWRACLVAASAYHYAGRADRARPWYDLARQHAVADGDEAALSSLMFNRATLQASQARIAAVFGCADAADAAALAHEALLGVESTASFEHGIGGASLPSMVPVVRAQLLVDEGRCAEALALYEQWFERAMADGQARLRAYFLADIAWCRLQLGREAAARADLAQSLQAVAGCETDDRAVAAARIAQVLAALGDDAQATVWRGRAERDLAAHRAEQQRLAALLDDALAAS
ncbi:hypothetical protein [Azohydromonas sediminis]|uniref:hypothetical protein n=1 Tax=Azohydromonas sediminis TaxID=2259674 RepID=UPI000E65A7FB|nr:hypothetical protein [Azohydromonas sediminis]